MGGGPRTVDAVGVEGILRGRGQVLVWGHVDDQMWCREDDSAPTSALGRMLRSTGARPHLLGSTESRWDVAEDFEAYRGSVTSTGNDEEATRQPADMPREPDDRVAAGDQRSLVEDERLTRLLGGERPSEEAARRLADATALVRDEPAARPRRRRAWRRSRRAQQARIDAAERDARALVERILCPFDGARRVAVASTKGGVGKTTITVLLGHTLASLRDDRVVALDANPDAGTLAHRIERESSANAVDLLDLVGSVRDYYDLRHFTSQAASRLEVIAAPEDPRDTRGITRSDMHELLDRLSLDYTLLLADCGTGVTTAATRAIVEAVDQLVIVTARRVDSVRSVTYMLRWLEGAGFGDLVADAVVVVNGLREDTGVDVEALVAHFEPIVRTVVAVPWDCDLARGGTTDLGYLRASTRHAIAQLAAAVADGFAAPQRQGPGS